MVDSSYPIFLRVFGFWQISSQDGIVGYIEKTDHGMPAFVVKPHLQEEEPISRFNEPMANRMSASCLLHQITT